MMTKFFMPGRVLGKERMMLAIPDIILAALSITLIFLSIVYARERIIFSDTAVYLFDLVRTRHFVVPTNRFISILSQLLPRAGLGLGLPLQAIVVLYSVNLILLPVGSAMLVRYVFKQPGLALAILLFYIIMGSSLFYYPVSEFQMGLCLLFVYHGLLLAFKKGNIYNAVYYITGTVLLIFITFSHPLALPVFVAWLVWVLLTEPSLKIRDLLFPLFLVLLAYCIKERFFKAMIGNEAFDESRAAGLKNFAGTLCSYFNNHLVPSSLKSIWGDHFIAVLLLLLSLVYLLRQRKWVVAALLVTTCLGFWLLVSVTFRDMNYNYYYEHLYQPLPFFISLAFVSYGIKLLRPFPVRTAIVVLAMTIALVKVNNGHEHNAWRHAWLERYFGLMEKFGLRKAAIGSAYAIEDRELCWSVPCESILLSSLDRKDSGKAIFITTDFHTLQEELIQTDGLLLGVKCWAIIEDLDPVYFRLNTDKPYSILDSLAERRVLDSLAYAK